MMSRCEVQRELRNKCVTERHFCERMREALRQSADRIRPKVGSYGYAIKI
jgi:hypothetical protein